MPLHTCAGCGALLPYEGLCRKCREEKQRREILAWTPEEVAHRQRALLEELPALERMDDQAERDFWALLSCWDGITPDIQRAALAQGVRSPVELFYHAPEDVRDGLIDALLQTESPGEANCLMCCVAMQGDDKALETLLELERNPRPWQESLYVPPSVYAQCGGWTFDSAGVRRMLHFETCYPLVQGEPGVDSPVRVAQPREERCPHCGSRLVDLLVVDGREPCLHFLGVDGIIKATCCPVCTMYSEPVFSRFTLEGESTMLPFEPDWVDEMVKEEMEEDYPKFTANGLALGEKRVPLFYGGNEKNIDLLGGFADWVQDWNYTPCPDCGKPMKFLAQIQWGALLGGGEGTIYVELCPECHVTSMQYQQS